MLIFPTQWLVVGILVGPIAIGVIALALGSWLCPFSETPCAVRPSPMPDKARTPVAFDRDSAVDSVASPPRSGPTAIGPDR